MKKKVLYSLLGLLLLIVFLLKSGLLYFGFAPFAYYELNENEAQMINSGIANFRERVRDEKFKEISAEMISLDPDERYIKTDLKDIKEIREQIANPISSEFFRAMPPYEAGEFYKNVSGQMYHIRYLSKSEKGEFSEGFEWIINDGQAKLFRYSAKPLVEWEIQNRERDRWKAEHFAHKIIIPLGNFFNPIEIRY